ncbi:MAG TPA: phospholipase D family protein [Guyparkeria sp.]|nr:phospholipase D family protein [Guyparkeria sp.]
MISAYPPTSNRGRLSSDLAIRTASARLGFHRAVTVLAVGLLHGCFQLPSLDGRSSSMLLQDTSDTQLGKAALPMTQAHPGKSGVFALSDGRDAFAARVLLADASERSLDIQYYIWNGDKTGTLLFGAVRRAADRGVRVRLLLDDNGTAGLDTVLAALDAHPNIEVRLFNPFMHRRWRALSFLIDFCRLNRRMHNKSFIADNQATIIGGRNVGDEYFDAGQGVSFVDLDVLAIGPVVNDVSKDFDRYWNSDSSYPAELVLPRVSQAAIAEVTAAAARVEKDPAAIAYMQAIAHSQYVRQVLARQLPFEWATVQMVSDDPAKGLGLARDDELMWTRLKQLLQTPQYELELISPYFVPGTEGVEYFSALARQGIKVTILTNSLAATDVTAVHAGYAKRRKPMLEAGVEMFEMEPEFSPAPTKGHGPLGSSSASLHAKTFSIDRSRVFVGSFNFDPRSQRLNTELGFVIDSPAMAVAIADTFATIIPERAYRVRMNDAGALQWVEQRNGKEMVYDQEPRTGFWLRAFVGVLSALPIEWML